MPLSRGWDSGGGQTGDGLVPAVGGFVDTVRAQAPRAQGVGAVFVREESDPCPAAQWRSRAGSAFGNGTGSRHRGNGDGHQELAPTRRDLSAGSAVKGLAWQRLGSHLISPLMRPGTHQPFILNVGFAGVRKCFCTIWSKTTSLSPRVRLVLPPAGGQLCSRAMGLEESVAEVIFELAFPSKYRG